MKETDGKFKSEQRNKIKYFFNLCKYYVVPGMVGGSAASLLFMQYYNSLGALDVSLFGATAGAALVMAANAGITGIKMNREEKHKYLEDLTEENKKGKSL